MISSSRSNASAPSFARCSSSVETFFAYICEAWYGTVDGRFVGPRTVTPLGDTTASPPFVSSQLPPRSAARSTTTDPGGMPATMSAVTRIGAVFPGTSAVVTTTSLPATTRVMVSRCRR